MSRHARSASGRSREGNGPRRGEGRRESLRALREEREVLLKELAHRTNNGMNAVSGLIGMQAAVLEDESQRGRLQSLQERIRAMALVHETLFRSPALRSIALKDFIGDLVDSLPRLQRGDAAPVRVELDVDDIFLPVDATLPFGLIICELVLNSIKHAFRPLGRAGAIFLSIRRSEDGMELRYRDDGPGLPRELDLSTSRALGLKLVRIIAVRNLRGTMEVRQGPGTEFVFRFGGFGFMASDGSRTCPAGGKR